MARSRSHRKSRRGIVGPYKIGPARKTENLRGDLVTARRERHFYGERRQFVDELPPSRMVLPDDLIGNYQETYSRVDGRPAEIVQSLPRNRNNSDLRKSDLQETLHSYFEDSPRLVSVCVRREKRRRVLFALQRTDKGSGRGKRHHWSELSKVRCV